jgi:hypothetical protein
LPIEEGGSYQACHRARHREEEEEGRVYNGDFHGEVGGLDAQDELLRALGHGEGVADEEVSGGVLVVGEREKGLELQGTVALDRVRSGGEGVALHSGFEIEL